MGFLDDIVSTGVYALGAEHSGLLGSAMQFVQSQPGGVSGLVQQLQSGGLGTVVSSWISNGENQPISAEQIESVIGSDRIQTVADTLGIDSQTLAQGLSQVLPKLIDQLSPNGQLPDEDTIQQSVQTMKGLL